MSSRPTQLRVSPGARERLLGLGGVERLHLAGDTPHRPAQLEPAGELVCRARPQAGAEEQIEALLGRARRRRSPCGRRGRGGSSSPPRPGCRDRRSPAARRPSSSRAWRRRGRRSRPAARRPARAARTAADSPCVARPVRARRRGEPAADPTFMPLTRSETRRAPRLVNSARRASFSSTSHAPRRPRPAAARGPPPRRRRRCRRGCRQGHRAGGGPARAGALGSLPARRRRPAAAARVASGGGKTICQRNRTAIDRTAAINRRLLSKGLGLQKGRVSDGPRRASRYRRRRTAGNATAVRQALKSHARDPVRAGPGGHIRNRSARSGRPGARAAKASACSLASRAISSRFMAGPGRPRGRGRKGDAGGRRLASRRSSSRRKSAKSAPAAPGLKWAMRSLAGRRSRSGQRR